MEATPAMTSKEWSACIRTLEKDGSDAAEILTTFETALAAGFDRGSDFRELWLCYLSYLRRNTNWKDEKEIERLRRNFQVANEHLGNFPDGDPDFVIPLFLATIEAKFLDNMEEARNLWQTVLSVDQFATKADSWIEYAYFERLFGDEEHFRQALLTALEKPLDFPETIGEILAKYEREEGESVTSYEEAYTKYRNAANKAKKRFLKAKKKEAFEKEKTKEEKKNSKKSERRETNDSPIKMDTTSDTSQDVFKLPQAPDDGDELPKAPGAKKAKLSADAVKDAKLLAEMERQTQYKIGEREANELNTVMISNLDFSLTEEQLREIFSQFGEIVDVRLVRKYNGRSKGYAYIEYADIRSVNKALKNDRMIVEGRPAFINEFGKRHGLQYSTSRENHKLFVSNLTPNVTQEMLRELFQKYGQLIDVRLATRRDGSSKGVAYVEFNDDGQARRALEANGMVLDEQEISVAISNPPPKGSKKDTRLLGEAKSKLVPNM